MVLSLDHVHMTGLLLELYKQLTKVKIILSPLVFEPLSRPV